MSDYSNIKVKKLETSELEIEGEILAEKIESHIDEALQHLGKDVEIPGFRKGKVPTDMLKQKLGEMAVWTEAAEHALRTEYPEILKTAIEKEKGAEPISSPEITITKMAPGNPLGFKAKIALMPEVKLPDYKKIAKKKLEEKSAEPEVGDKEVEDLMLQLQKARGKHEKAIKDKGKEKDALSEEPNEVKQEGGALLDAQGNPIKKEDDADLPKFDDEFAKSLGDFKSVDDFKKRAKENLIEEKKMRAKEELRFGIIDAVVDEAKIVLPEALVRGELQQMMAQFEGDIARAGHTMADYLKRSNKTEEDLQKEWRPKADKRAKTQLVLHAIAEAEKLEPEKEKVEENVAKMMAQYKDADENRARAYISSLLQNEKVFEFLEGLH